MLPECAIALTSPLVTSPESGMAVIAHAVGGNSNGVVSAASEASAVVVERRQRQVVPSPLGERPIHAVSGRLILGSLIVDLGDQLLSVESGIGRHDVGGADHVSETRTAEHCAELARQAS